MSGSGKYVIIHFIAIDAANTEWPSPLRARAAGMLSKETGSVWSQNDLLSGWNMRLTVTRALATELLGALVWDQLYIIMSTFAFGPDGSHFYLKLAAGIAHALPLSSCS